MSKKLIILNKSMISAYEAFERILVCFEKTS